MENKNKSITVYFHNDVDLFNELMKMNKFYRSQFIRDCIRNTLFNKSTMNDTKQEIQEKTADNTAQPVILPQPEVKDAVKNIKENNTEYKKQVYEDDNDPMSIF